MTLHDKIKELDTDTTPILEAYVARAERLDSTLAALTRSYCAHCPRDAEYGCCDFPEEAVREMPTDAIGLQETECLENGGDLREREGICRYHTSDGCSLRLMKSPSCLGQLCGNLKDELARQYPEHAEPFVVAMGKLMSGSLQQDPAGLFRAMDEVIVAGEGRLGRGAEHGAAQDGESAGAISPPVS